MCAEHLGKSAHLWFCNVPVTARPQGQGCKAKWRQSSTNASTCGSWRLVASSGCQFVYIPVLNRQKVFKELETCVRQHGLRVELHTFYAQFAVAQTHDYAVVGFGGNFEFARKRFPIDDERVIARRNEWQRQAAEYFFTVMLNFAGFSVH